VRGPEPDHLIATADGCVEVLAPLVDRDWDVPAAGLDWTCRQTIEHVCGLGYAPVLATRSTSFRPLALTVAPGAPLDDLLHTMQAMARILAEVARAAPASTRAYHPAGMADPSGFVAMLMDELLVHTADIATGLGAPYTPDQRLVTVVLERLFPWAPADADRWAALLWANGRVDLPDQPSLGEAWLWHCAPLEEWDGTVPEWDPVARRKVAPS
jgi:uncharacterized protein (TIGR03083 family)